MQTASKSLMEAITEVYESGWSGHDLLYVQSQNMEMLWQDFSHKLGDQVLIPLNTYTNQYPEVRVSFILTILMLFITFISVITTIVIEVVIFKVFIYYM